MAKKTKPPELRVVFDSSVLYTGSANDLIRNEVAEVILANSNHADLTVTWYLPDVVRHERQFQMLEKALEMLPTIQRLERLLGHNLNITEEIVRSRVNEAVEKEINRLSLKQLSLRPADVEWQRLILDAAYRKPPFAVGETEKGFRDSLIAESVVQLVADSPVTPKVCRIAFVTGDNLLATAVRARTETNPNVRILGDLDELKGLITTLVSEVGEEFIAGIRALAKAYFFEQKKQESLYYREHVRDTIQQKFQNELSALPAGADRRENDATWYIFDPRFLKKQGQRIHWATRVEVGTRALKREIESPLLATFRAILGAQAALKLPPSETRRELGPTSPLPSLGTGGQPASLEEAKETVVAKGKSIFSVTWSAVVTATKKFRLPKIEGIEFAETQWEK